MPFSQVVITYAFQYYQFGYTDIVYITTRMLPYLLFLFLFGTYIYKHFCTAGVYVFSRCENRLKWIAKEIAQLFGFCVLFTVLIPLLVWHWRVWLTMLRLEKLIYTYIFTMWQSMRCGCFCNITGEYAGNQVWRDERFWTCGYRNLRLRCIVVIVG